SFFLQAEDGIRDFHVTGVQTCALPIYALTGSDVEVIEDFSIASRQRIRDEIDDQVAQFLARGGKINEIPANVTADPPKKPSPDRSEERRVGKDYSVLWTSNLYKDEAAL